MNTNPPLLHHYRNLVHEMVENDSVMMEDYCQLPLIDLNGLKSEDEMVKMGCCDTICKASSEWGFFQVVNHGISSELLNKMKNEQMNLFQSSFDKKTAPGLLKNSYRWGSTNATYVKQFSWSESFHIPLINISDHASYADFTSLREVVTEFAEAMSKVARLLSGILAANLGEKKEVFDEVCDESTCFLRLNRYPACPISRQIHGLVPHTDSDFLTVLYQDQVGGLQLMKDSKWVHVKPNQDALIVNIGDLFQAWSNNVYKSVEHKVMSNEKMERYSIAYFQCPSYDSLIKSCKQTSLYRPFTFGEYRKQVQQDVRIVGHKVGLSRFLL